MDITHVETYKKLSKEVAKLVYNRLSEGLLANDHFVMCIPTGETPQGMYGELIHLASVENLDLSHLYTFNLDEYYPIKKNHPRSYNYEIMHSFLKPLNVANPTFLLENAYILDGEAPDATKECQRYEKKIEELGGIDLAILGLGVNGHIGFNEPGSPPESRTRLVNIDTETVMHNSRFFDGKVEQVPVSALTMGIATILQSREIYLMVHGQSKQDIFNKMIAIDTSSPDIPASFIMNHAKARIFTDLPNTSS